MRPGLPKTDKHTLGGISALVVAVALITLTWFVTVHAIRAERQEVQAQAVATVTRQATSLEMQIGRQILLLDETLRLLAHAWEAAPDTFDLREWRRDTTLLGDISSDILLVDERGIVRQATIAAAIGTDAFAEDYLRYARDHGADEGTFIGSTTTSPMMPQLHMNVARQLHRRDGSFAGAIVLDYRFDAIDALLHQTDLGDDPMIALIGRTDGTLRAEAGSAPAAPGTNIAATPMFQAMTRAPDEVWTGISAIDAAPRIHAFRRLPGRDLEVVVGMDLREAMAPARLWEWRADIIAGAITVVVATAAAFLLFRLRQARRHEARLVEDRAQLALANMKLADAKARADAKTSQLEAALAGMSDGVSMFDRDLRLAAWNARFPELAGIPADLLRIGLPLEDILHAQCATGQFGSVDAGTEVARRIAAIRDGRSDGVVERRRPDGRILELRRNRLPDGGFVTLYADITDRKQIEVALRAARTLADDANQAKSRFVAVVSHEIRNPLGALLNSLRLLADSFMGPAQRRLVESARQSGDALFSLINDILEMSRMEAGQLALRPSVFGLRPLLDSAVEIFRAQASARGITIVCEVAPDVPGNFFADPGRLRQVLTNLLSNAVKFARAGEVTLVVRRDAKASDGAPMLRLAIRDLGPMIPPEERLLLFRPFFRRVHANEDHKSLDETLSTGLGLAICHHLATLMGGEIGCSSWHDGTARSGNEFWLCLPISALPSQTSAKAGREPAQNSIMPRTRVLLVEDISANQLVTATLLRAEGHMVDIVGSGEAAIAAVRRSPYDVVLMDLVMPGIGGLESAQRIRAIGGPAGQMRILALTGAASAADRAVARQAGMDAVLTKPVLLPMILDAIARHVWPGLPRYRAMAASPAAPGTAAGPVLAAARVEELRANLPSDILSSMIEECLEELGHRLPALRRALEANNAAEITSQTHAMAGLAAGYGMAALEASLRCLMAAANTPEARDPAVWAADLDAQLQTAAGALREAVQKELA